MYTRIWTDFVTATRRGVFNNSDPVFLVAIMLTILLVKYDMP